MIKFFRKHNKTILWGMAILMVMFLVPSLLDFQGRMGNPVVGTFEYAGHKEKVTQNDLNAALNNLRLLRDFEAGRYGGQGVFSRQVAGLLGPGEGADIGRAQSENWHLWVRKARLHGFRSTEEQRQALFDAFKIRPSDRQLIADRYETTIEAVDAAFDEVVIVNQLVAVLAQSVGAPENEVRLAVRDLGERVTVDLVDPDLELLATLVPTPTTQPQIDHFGTYKDKTRGAGRFDFGYRLPDRVAVEILAADAEDLISNPSLLKISEEDARKYWITHKSDFVREPAAATQPGTTQPAASQPTTQPRFEDHEQEILKAMARETGGKYDAEAKVVGLMKGLVARGRQDQAVLYGQADKPAEGTLAAEVQKEGLAPKVYRTNLFAADEVFEAFSDSKYGQLPFLIANGRAVGSERDQGGTMLQQAFNVAELVASTSEFDRPLKVGEQAPEVYQFGTTYFIWRVIDADKARAPASLDEVADKVVADMKARAAYDLAVERIRQVNDLAGDGMKLDEAVEKVNKELAGPLPTTQPATAAASQPETPEYLRLSRRSLTRKELDMSQLRMPFGEMVKYLTMGGQMTEQQAREEIIAYYGMIADSRAARPQVVNTAFQMAADRPATTRPESPATQPREGAGRLVLDEAEGLVTLVRFQSLAPATTSDYARDRGLVHRLLLRNAGYEARMNWVMGLRTQMNYSPAGKSEGE